MLRRRSDRHLSPKSSPPSARQARGLRFRPPAVWPRSPSTTCISPRSYWSAPCAVGHDIGCWPASPRTGRRAAPHGWGVCAVVLALACSLAERAIAQDLPTLSVKDASADETYDTVNGVAATIDFVVSLSATSSAATVAYATSDGTARARTDYEVASGTLTFGVGTAEQTVSVSLVDNRRNELPETFLLTLSDATGAVIDRGVATGTIRDDDPEPEFKSRFTNPSIVEGRFGFGRLSMPVYLSVWSGRTVTVDYATESHGANPAEAGVDYTHAAGTLTFDPGEVGKTIRIGILPADDVYEGTEEFSLRFSNPDGATISSDPLVVPIKVHDTLRRPRVTIGDALDVESAGELAFPVTLTGPIEGSMKYSTVDGTAVAGQDYTAANDATLSFGGETNKTIRVAIVDDDVEETAAETLTVRLSQTIPSLIWSVGDLDATGTILDDDGAARLDIADSSATEGDTLSFAVRLSGRRSGSVTVDYATVAGTATAGRDYAEVSGTLTFAVGEVLKTIAVASMDDSTHEGSESFSVSLADPTGATLGQGTGTGTIIDDEGPPTMTIHGSEGPETGLLDFVVTLSHTSSASVTADYSTDDFVAYDPPAYRLAEAGTDFTYQAGSVTFAPGETSKTIQVQVLEDLIDEPTEAVVVTLKNPANAQFVHRAGTDMCPWGACAGLACCDCATILDDDETAFSITGGTAPEGGAVSFSVTLAGSSSLAATVSYATSDGTAVAVDDYGATSGTLTFASGESDKTVMVSLVDDGIDEADETFAVTLSSPMNATIKTAKADGTIADNDDPPEVAIGDAEGEEGETVAFEVTLTETSGREVSVAYATSDGTATGGEDYGTAAGVLTFAPGEKTKTVSVELNADGKDEFDEAFNVVLSSATNATLGKPTGTGTINDADDPTVVSVGAASGVEGSEAGFTVTLGAASDFEVLVDYATEDGTAVAGEDFVAASGTLTFAPGEETRTVSVRLTDDVVDEPAENFSLTLGSPVNATIGASTAEGTIMDNDDPPAFSVADGAGVEGGLAEFSVTLVGSGSRTATVSYGTSDRTADAVDDYEAASGTLTFAPGESSRTLSVVLVDDTVDEPAETFAVTLSSASNATIDSATAEGTITDNDGTPQLSITGAQGSEGDVLVFAVTLAGSSDRAATVSYATSDSTAVAGEDYEAASGTLTFAPGESRHSLSVRLLNDSVHEATETFTVTLSSSDNAEVAIDQAVGRIVDDDALPTLSVVGGSGREGAVAEFVVTLAGSSSVPVTVDYSTTDGSAVAGEDYLATSGTLSFALGGGVMRIAVTLVADGADEPDETFVLRLRSPIKRDPVGGRRHGNDRGCRRTAHAVGGRGRSRGRRSGGVRGDARRFNAPARVGGVRDR